MGLFISKNRPAGPGGGRRIKVDYMEMQEAKFI
jgi:hypothetical protein